MARASTARRLDDSQTEQALRVPSFGGGDPPSPPIRDNEPVVSNARLGVLALLGAEAMFFAGLIGAFLVFRLASSTWPPPFQPRLPIGVTGVNTGILLLSAYTMHLGLRALRDGAVRQFVRLLLATGALGAIFLLIQGYEWIRLIHFGLTVSSSVYGGLFYTLIGFHGIHVVGALIWLAAVLIQAQRGRFSPRRYTGVQTCAMYWTFVVALWPILYGLVYLY
jgi:heme/copper-type cytochrome/quinol oxidase subunit 3